jgi:tyrosine-specific transport protein
MKSNKFIGSILIIIGTSIGAGMLALPIISAASGFFNAALLMIFIWFLMTLTALLVLEVNLYCPSHANNFGAMAYKTLGKSGQIVTSILFLLLLYSLLAAYTTGATGLLEGLFYLLLHIKLPTWFCALLFICILGSVVFWSTKAVDYTNRILMMMKISLLAASIIFLILQLNPANISYCYTNVSNKILCTVAPIFLCAFGFHVVIPSLRNYVGDKRKELQLIIIVATTIILVIYLLWLLAILGALPANTIQNKAHSVNGLLSAIASINNNKKVITAISAFSSISMSTSFLGVALAVFDFLAEAYKHITIKNNRLPIAFLTFLPPLFFVLCYPEGFMTALRYASFFVIILLVVLPALMAYKVCQQSEALTANFLLNKYLLGIIFIIGMALIIIEFLTNSTILTLSHVAH